MAAFARHVATASSGCARWQCTQVFCAACPCDWGPQASCHGVAQTWPLLKFHSRPNERLVGSNTGEELFLDKQSLRGIVFQNRRLLRHSEESAVLGLHRVEGLCAGIGGQGIQNSFTFFCGVTIKSSRILACLIARQTMRRRGCVGVLVGSQLAACEVCGLVLIRLLTARPWSLSQDEIS